MKVIYTHNPLPNEQLTDTRQPLTPHNIGRIISFRTEELFCINRHTTEESSYAPYSCPHRTLL
jgi:hypothetical protein